MQSLNGNIFRNPQKVMQNIGKIETSFRNSGQDIVTIPEYITADGKNYVEFGNEVWRMYRYTEQEDLPSDRDYLTGYAFGKYINIINKDIVLDNTIENFHNFEMYYNRLPAGTEKYFDGLRDKLRIFDDIPERNVHNDAKTDNIIFGQKITVIDLDTSMKGYIAIDYGDMIRSAGTENIEELTRGFADGLGDLLTPAEKDSLYYGILYVTGELAMRYIIDSVSGRRYFNTKTPTQCRKRAVDLMKQLEYYENNTGIKNIIRKAF
ncbi:MAG: aminoglycoside phosphotransferase family protein [Ruminococcus sp.]|nr:aminoglycoside phosphotransferase family protein [Ruminococcus sp.]